jgi:hypothetical protein
MMTERESDDMPRRRRAWSVAGAHLSRERAMRLRAMDDEEARKVIARIFSGPLPTRVARESGLILQQQLFRKLK